MALHQLLPSQVLRASRRELVDAGVGNGRTVLGPRAELQGRSKLVELLLESGRVHLAGPSVRRVVPPVHHQVPLHQAAQVLVDIQGGRDEAEEADGILLGSGRILHQGHRLPPLAREVAEGVHHQDLVTVGEVHLLQQVLQHAPARGHPTLASPLCRRELPVTSSGAPAHGDHVAWPDQWHALQS
eukprot:14296610-Alexandrium_andersonii.AAC.1